jgi:hypothetical protein
MLLNIYLKSEELQKNNVEANRSGVKKAARSLMKAIDKGKV